jgi:serine/threonine protein phosphatase PrpC
MHAITQRYFGQGPYLQVECSSCSLEELDRILLITNGVIDVFPPEEAANIVDHYEDICRAARELVRLSRARGSQGDITAVLIEVEF